RAPGHAALEQVQLVGANVLGAEHLRRAAEVPGKAGDLADVGVDGAACVVAQAQVVGEGLAKRGHGGSPTGGKGNAEGEPRAYAEKDSAAAGRAAAMHHRRLSERRGANHRVAV